MNARTYVRRNIFFYNARKSFVGFLVFGWVFFLVPCICLYLYFVKGLYINLGAVLTAMVLISIPFIAPSISAVMRSKKYCDSLEQRGLMEEAARQLRAQSRWKEPYILTNDYYFAMDKGQVICLKDLVRIELTIKSEYDSDGPDTEGLYLRLTTRQGDTLTSYGSYRLRTPKEKRVLQQKFDLLRTRYPEIAVETDSRDK